MEKYSDTNVGTGEGYTTLPLYATGFLRQAARDQLVDIIDVRNLKVPS